MHSPIPSPRLCNPDLAPVPPEERTWTAGHFAALWVSMAVCIPAYTGAAGLMSQGMKWWQALTTILLGNLIVLIPMLLNAHAGTRYGIPFPVLVRASFGTFGANVPALMRAIIACGWFGIQTWIGGESIYLVLSNLMHFKPATSADQLPGLGLSAGQFACFLFFWAAQMLLIIRGMRVLRRVETLAAPLLLLGGIVLLGWAASVGGGFGKLLAFTHASEQGSRGFWPIFWPNLTATVGFWATLSLNIPDFTRYARSQRDQVVGQSLALPLSMLLVSFIGIAVSNATVIKFGEVIWNPVELVGRFESPWVVVIGLFAIILATLSTNLAANIVSPANDFANVNPAKINFRKGAMITGVIGILILPWRLYTDLGQYIFTWLIGYGALLGAIAGVMLTDYYVVRRCRLEVDDLYREDGQYPRVNQTAMISLAVGIAPNLPGFIAHASGRQDSLAPFWNGLYTHAWFVSLFLSAAIYFLLTKFTSRTNPDVIS